MPLLDALRLVDDLESAGVNLDKVFSFTKIVTVFCGTDKGDYKATPVAADGTGATMYTVPMGPHAKNHRIIDAWYEPTFNLNAMQSFYQIQAYPASSLSSKGKYDQIYLILGAYPGQNAHLGITLHCLVGLA